MMSGELGVALRRLASVQIVEPFRGSERYRVCRQLGEGGFGAVYEVEDRRLGRRVAIKTLRRMRRPAADASTGSSSHDREVPMVLLREAQALARLSHPNVVGVHEIDLDADAPYVVMELVEGCSLRTWCQKRRPWQEVVGVFIQAGRGLAAAHASGMIHGDFKPDNVLVGNDGRVRVADFGLARVASSATATESVDSPSKVRGHTEDDRARADATPRGTPASGRASSTCVERRPAGGPCGTPMYLAPELWEGAEHSERSDQFAFCVSLWEAVFGVPPFGDRPALVSAWPGRAKPIAPPASVRAPNRLRRALERGLRCEPGERHPSMDTLIDLLERIHRAPACRRRGLFVAALGTTALGVGHLSAALAQPGPGEVDKAVITDTRDAVRRARVVEASAASRRVFFPYPSSVVTQQLDAYSQRWQLAHSSSWDRRTNAFREPELSSESAVTAYFGEKGLASAVSRRVGKTTHASANEKIRNRTEAGRVLDNDKGD